MKGDYALAAANVADRQVACAVLPFGAATTAVRVRAAPKIRIGFLESGDGWIVPWFDRMDRHFDDKFFNDSDLGARPSELFQCNCWISFEPIEISLWVIADFIGPNKIMWATDYPHPTVSSLARPAEWFAWTG